MRILCAHNFYVQPGGEDIVFAAETGLLRGFGHQVIEYVKHNKTIEPGNRLDLLRTTLWSRTAYDELSALIRARKPDVLHLHNTMPLISPAAVHAAKAHGVATVQTLHNYRLICPNALLFRDNRPCEDCLGKAFAWPGVLHACYRGSRASSLAVALMNAKHHRLGTWTEKTDVLIALTESSRQKFIAGGLPSDKIVVKPNFLPQDPGEGRGRGRCAVFAGRLAAEKGILTLLDAWRRIGPRLPLKIIGGGPLADAVREQVEQGDGVEWLGERSREFVLSMIGEAALLVIPSEWHEPFGLVVIEAFARGTPVLAADIGSLGELVRDGHTGFLFRPGDPSDLVAKVETFLAHPDRAVAMRRAARQAYEARFTAEQNYGMLLEIYRRAINSNAAQQRNAGAKPLARG